LPRSTPPTETAPLKCAVEIPIALLGGKWKLFLVYDLPSDLQRTGLCEP
jgi:hypothetical protein